MTAKKGRKRRPQNTSDLARARAGRDDKGRFLKGQSGNPGGRPIEERAMKELARSFTVEAIEKLVSLMRAADDQRVQFLAAQELLDRGYGRAAPAVASGPLVSISMGGAQQISSADASRIYSEVMGNPAIDLDQLQFAEQPALPAPVAEEEKPK